MYTMDKSQRITLRLNPNQFAFVSSSAEAIGVSPSEFLRMVVNIAMTSVNKANELQRANIKDLEIESIKIESEGIGRENDEANKHDIV